MTTPPPIRPHFRNPLVSALFLWACLAFFALSAPAQPSKRGLVRHEKEAFKGYTLFTPLRSKMTYLIDMEGRVVHEWKSVHAPSNSAYLLPNGNLLRPAKVLGNETFGSRGPSGGRVELFDWNGKLLWDYIYSSDLHHQHHDIEPLPNGNVLILAWERVSREEAIAAGRKPESVPEQGLFPDKIVEVQQTGPTSGKIVWEWRAWDHLIQDLDPSKANYGEVGARPDRLDVNLNPRPRSDWMHTNGIHYNSELDQIALSCRTFNEILIIDHSASTEETRGSSGGRAGKGGDILYRWGNPANYRAGAPSEQTLFGQHDARWTPRGSLTIFNNGSRRPQGEWSSIEEINPPINANGSYRISAGESFDPRKPDWSYVAPNPTDFYSSFISGAERLPNGNTLICSGADGIFFEVTVKGEIVWEYRNPFELPPAGPEGPHSVFRVVRYGLDYPGLNGKTLKPLLAPTKG